MKGASVFAALLLTAPGHTVVKLISDLTVSISEGHKPNRLGTTALEYAWRSASVYWVTPMCAFLSVDHCVTMKRRKSP